MRGSKHQTILFFACALAISSAAVHAAEWEKVESVDALVRELRVWDEKATHNQRAGGVWVDPRSGDVYVGIAHRPIHRSTDQGATWKQWGPDWLTGKLHYPTGLGIDHPYRGRILFFGKHGTSGLTLDDGKTWLKLPKNLVNGDTDWASDVPSVFISFGDHGKTNMSIDGGKTWHKNGIVKGKSLGFFHMGLIDGKTMLVATGEEGLEVVTGTLDGQPVAFTPRYIQNKKLVVTDAQSHYFKGIYTTTNLLGPWDYARDFTKISDLNPIAPNPLHWDNGRMYWAAVEGLLVSEDGLDWRVHSDGVKNVEWVVFGKTEKDILVLDEAKTPFITSDGGKTWRKVAPAFDVDQPWDSTTFGWDPVNKLIYASPANYSLYRIRYEGAAE